MNIKRIFDTDHIEKLLVAKDNYGQLLSFRINNIICVFRLLTMKEIETIGKFADKIDDTVIEDLIIKKTLIVCSVDNNYLFNKIGYGYISTIARNIMVSSNIKEENKFLIELDESRKTAATIQNNMEALLIKAFPSLNPEQIKNLTQYKQLSLVGLAELITGVKLDIKKQKSSNRRNILQEISEGEVTLSASELTSPLAGDKPEF